MGEWESGGVDFPPRQEIVQQYQNNSPSPPLSRSPAPSNMKGNRKRGKGVMDWKKEPIKVNKILGKQAGFGPIPANQILPWFAIITITYFIFDGLLSWGIPKVAVISFWLILSWWFVTGKDPDKYINLFRKPKGSNWIIGGAIYISPLLSRNIRKQLKRQRAGGRRQKE